MKKVRNIQHPEAYAYKTNMLWDLYFGLTLHHIVQQNSLSQQLFPDFKNMSVSNFKGKGDASESKTSDLWNKYFKEMVQIADLYKGMIKYNLIIPLYKSAI